MNDVYVIEKSFAQYPGSFVQLRVAGVLSSKKPGGVVKITTDQEFFRVVLNGKNARIVSYCIRLATSRSDISLML